jgi:hypothetical protein
MSALAFRRRFVRSRFEVTSDEPTEGFRVKKKTVRPLALRPSSSALAVGLLSVLFYSFNCIAQDPEFYPGPLRIVKAKHLSAEEREVEIRFARYLEAHTLEAIIRYSAKYGKEISTDNVRELSPDYAPGGPDAVDPVTNAARTKWGEAVFQPARAMSRELYRRALGQVTPSHVRRQVVFTAGGAGVGKTTAIRRFRSIAQALEAAEIIYDTTLSDFNSAVARIKQGLDAGRMVSIIFVYRDPVESFTGGVLPRARTTGRVTTLEGFLNTHIGAAEGILKVAALYKDDPGVAIGVIDNTRGIANAVVADLSFVKKTAGQYSRQALRAELTRLTESAYEKGRKGEEDGLTEVLYRQFLRRTP